MLDQIDAESVIVRTREAEFLRRHGYGGGCQIHYHSNTESAAAELLKSVLETAVPGRRFVLHPVADLTPRFVSIFVGDTL